jgi:hypothetical protein
MPFYWEDKGAEEREKTIATIWAALCAGRSLPLPEGFGGGAGGYLVIVKDEPVTLRAMMPGSSSRSIAVGFPGYQSVCFDAELCRLRYAWKGDFLDMSPVWGGRGGVPARVLGEVWWRAPDGLPFRFGEKEPKAVFRGYQLDKEKVPVFRYALDGVEATERITPLAEGLGLVREFELGETKEDAFLLEAPGLSCSAGEFRDGKVRVGGRFRVTVKR